MDREAANAPRTRDRPGTYEVWFVTLNDGAGHGFWFRYTTFQPGPLSQVEAHSALWAFSFDRADPSRNLAVKETYPLNALELGLPFRVRLPGADLEAGGCCGHLPGIRWELGWESLDPRPTAILPRRMEFISSVGVVGSQPQLRVGGRVELGDRTIRLANAYGGQQHTWGSSHARSWNWGHAAGDWGWLAGFTSRGRSRFGRELRTTALDGRLRGRRPSGNGLLASLRSPGVIQPDRWTTQLGDARLSIVPRAEDLIAVRYDDPAGGDRFCYHSELADAELELGEERLRLEAVAAFEYASTEPLPGRPPAL